MTIPESAPAAATPPASDAAPALVRISRTELVWLTVGMWIGGIAILTVLPAVLVTQLGWGDLVGVVGSYFVFFLAWQPIQTITQRALGTRTALVRMLLLVVSAFSVAFLLKVMLFGPTE
jgi:hypothetical protein